MKTQHNDTYIARRKVQEERVSNALIEDGWIEWFHPELMPPIGHFKREKKIDFSCVDADDTWCRIDFVLGFDGGYVFLEVDEHQHKFGYDSLLSCDMKRMSKVMSSVAVEAHTNGNATPRIMWLRYNPNTCHVAGILQSVPKKEREAWLTSFLNGFTLDTFDTDLLIGYAYYDVSSEDQLEVLENEEYHEQFADVAINLTDAPLDCSDDLDVSAMCQPCDADVVSVDTDST